MDGLTNITFKKPQVEPVDLQDPLAHWVPVQRAEATGQKRKTYISSTNPMLQWRPLKGLFLDELLRQDGLGNDLDHPCCAHCDAHLSTTRMFRCSDWRQEWNGKFWVSETLENLGLIYQVGHGGFPCALPDPAIRKMVIIETPFIHTIKLRYCNCGQSDDTDSADADSEHLKQLLRNGWYPATVVEPATCATFRTLQAFRLYNVVGNMNWARFGPRSQSTIPAYDPAKTYLQTGVQSTRSSNFSTCSFLPSTPISASKIESEQTRLKTPPWDLVGAVGLSPRGYQEHVRKYVSETDVFAFPGLEAVSCARHGCVRPNGLGNLQKGERYSNMDWIIHVAERMTRLPAHMQLDLSRVKVQYGLPVWHAASHTGDCQEDNSLSFKPGVGKTDGEGIERNLGRSQSRGARNEGDVTRIDNHNFLKNLTHSQTLKRKLVVALAERQTQVQAFAAVNDGINKDVLKHWKKMIRDWLQDNTMPNPYVLQRKDCPTEAEVRLQLQRDEKQQMIEGRANLAGRSATAFLTAGIQIEDTQRRILAQLKGTVLLTADRESKVEEWRHTLLAKISRFRALQEVEMRAAITDDGLSGCIPGLFAMEVQLRVSQCLNCLSQLRSSLHAKRWLIAYRNANVTGQHQTTKAAQLIERVGERVEQLADRYRQGRRALVSLGVEQEYPHLHELKKEDIQLDGDRDDSDLASRKKLAMIGTGRASRNMPGTSRRVMSWIWTAPGAFDGDNAEEHHLHESIRVEWARARARKDRWDEEVMLLREEMRRVLRYLEWQAQWWRDQATRRKDWDSATAAGAEAYALKQGTWSERLVYEEEERCNDRRLILRTYKSLLPSYSTSWVGVTQGQTLKTKLSAVELLAFVMKPSTLRSAVKLRAYACNGIETIQAYRDNARRAAAKYREKCSTLFPFSKNKPC
ncbi:hypothetical protein B0H14DRAFT_3153313 [Mycena olivaceomarginata]|nr:hypothetical protein B0H14DRAFT_3153313 [Mycena olivaceomarginata]